VIRLASDVTERRRLREEAVRTSRLAALGELSAGVAHEINNPNALTLYNVPVLIDCFREMLPILEEHRRRHGDFALVGLSWDELQEEIPAMLKEVLDGAGRIQRIVEDLKNFVRQEDAEGAVPFDLNEAVGTAVRLTNNALQRATDHYVIDLGENLPPCRGIPQRIEQVVINLLQNAAQALPERRCRIRLSTCYDVGAGMNLVTVEDEGRGIEKEHLSHVTDPFFTTRRNSGGTGLGLSISARIVQEHHGRLEFASVPGQGTTVRLWLPTSNENQGDEA
jgi:signal transduction histidine kinase